MEVAEIQGCGNMKTIYLSGAISSWEDPFEWHDQLMESDDWDGVNFINPYEINDFELGDDEIYDRPNEVVEPALSAVEDSDGLLVRWDDDAFLVGTSMEMKHAFNHNVPVVIWYDGYKDNLSPWLLYHSRGILLFHNSRYHLVIANECRATHNYLPHYLIRGARCQHDTRHHTSREP